MWEIIKSLWPLWAFVGIILFIRIFFESLLPAIIDTLRGVFYQRKIQKQSFFNREWLSDRELLRMLRDMNPRAFEDYIADLFSKLGYKTETTGGPYDEGVDVIAEKNGIKHYIQCKKYITSTVGVKEVRDFYGAIADHLANGKGYFITTNKFTLEAEKFAEDKPIELIDGNRLIEYIHLAEKS
jgi:restriction system protein